MASNQEVMLVQSIRLVKQRCEEFLKANESEGMEEEESNAVSDLNDAITIYADNLWVFEERMNVGWSTITAEIVQKKMEEPNASDQS